MYARSARKMLLATHVAFSARARSTGNFCFFGSAEYFFLWVEVASGASCSHFLPRGALSYRRVFSNLFSPGRVVVALPLATYHSMLAV